MITHGCRSRLTSRRAHTSGGRQHDAAAKQPSDTAFRGESTWVDLPASGSRVENHYIIIDNEPMIVRAASQDDVPMITEIYNEAVLNGTAIPASKPGRIRKIGSRGGSVASEVEGSRQA